MSYVEATVDTSFGQRSEREQAWPGKEVENLANLAKNEVSDQ